MGGSGSKPPSSLDRGKVSTPAALDRQSLKQQLLTLGRTAEAREGVRKSGAKSGRFAIALDATGSMQPLINNAKQSIEAIMNRVFKEASVPIKIQLFVYRDYDVPRDVLAFSPLSEDAQELVRWLARVKALGGGANLGEAVNEPLQAIQKADCFDAVILAGDEPSLPRKYLDKIGKQQLLSALELAERSKIPIYTFVVGGMSETISDFKAIAEKSGGASGRLDGSEEMINMAVMAMLARLKGRSSVEEYMNQNRLSANSREFGNLLLAPPRR